MKELRERIENLLLGTYGIGSVMPSGRFSLGVGTTPENHPGNALERCVWVLVKPRIELYPVNPLDGMGLFEYPTEIKITYLYSPDGDLLGQSTNDSPLQGGSDLRNLSDRANEDIHKIQGVLQWGENWGGTNPEIFNLAPLAEGELVLDPEQSRAILTLQWKAWVQQDF